ncbi:MAG: hypothetical protein V1835_04270, partial [Candidatus Micrarchaeota archaeon]
MSGKYIGKLMQFLILLGLLINYAEAGTGCHPGMDPICGAIPQNDCDVMQNTTFQVGFYYLPAGIDICSNDIALDCNNAILAGDGGSTNYGISLISRSGTTIRNCNAYAYIAGLYIGTANMNTIENNKLYSNAYGI